MQARRRSKVPEIAGLLGQMMPGALGATVLAVDREKLGIGIFVVTEVLGRAEGAWLELVLDGAAQTFTVNESSVPARGMPSFAPARQGIRFRAIPRRTA